MKSLRLLATACVCGLVLLSFSRVRAAELLRAGDTVAICGDSITEQKLYSVFIGNYLLMCQPAADLRAHQFGWSGEAARGLANRIGHAVLPFKPSVATTCYGMNDGGYSPIDPKRQADYRAATTDIVKALKAGGVRTIVVGSPGVVDTDTFDKKANKKTPAAQYNETLADLSRIAREVAAEQGVAFADVYSPMLAAMAKAKAKYGPDYHLAGGDGIHPTANGHLVMAYAFLKALGCTGDIGTISFDLSAGRATATDGHKVGRLTAGSLEIESTRYPFCFTGDPASPDSTRGVLEFLPFNEELNRFRLVVTGATAPRLKVTWGDASKVFTSAQLATGINLAAEFPDNPFSQPFATVKTAVEQQQAFETPATKTLLQGLPAWTKLLPEEAPTLAKLTQAVVNKSRGLGDTARAAIVPVKHTLRIEPAS